MVLILGSSTPSVIKECQATSNTCCCGTGGGHIGWLVGGHVGGHVGGLVRGHIGGLVRGHIGGLVRGHIGIEFVTGSVRVRIYHSDRSRSIIRGSQIICTMVCR